MSSQTSQTNGITMVRALTKLKTLDKQIEAKVLGTTFLSVSGEIRPVEEVAKRAPSNFQRINDLIDFRRRLKSAIITSNANTQVTICGQTMSVAEAIEEKQSIKHKTRLLSTLRTQYSQRLHEVEQHNSRIRGNLERETRSNSNDDKNSDSSLEYQKNYMKRHEINLYDPISITTQIEKLDNYIREFECEVDHVLSESNAITRVDVKEVAMY